MRRVPAWLIGAGVIGAIGVAAGAAAAHMLRGADPRAAALVGTAAQYGIYHALALVGMAALESARPGYCGWVFGAAGWCFLVGAVLFSGSLLLLAATGATVIGYVTPVGGILLVLGWVLLAVNGLVRLRGGRGDRAQDQRR
jgi:uncharacterized membrane protein YgdD (TMEM256/DUF423 family)